MADLMHVASLYGGIEHLKGKKIAMCWAYSPSYGKPLSVPQAIITLLPRFGMDVVLAHPEGYDLLPDIVGMYVCMYACMYACMNMYAKMIHRVLAILAYISV